MFERFHRRGWHYALLLASGAALFLTNLGAATLWDLDEGRNATCAMEMLESDNYIVPTFNGELRVDKPALIYWLQVAAYRTFGVNEFSARLPSALAAMLTMLLCYELARSMFGKSTGLLAGLIVGSTPMLCGAGRFANPDALLNCFVVLTMLIFWLGHDRPTALWYTMLGAASGLAVLAKGPVGLVLPGMIALLFCLWAGRLRPLLGRQLSCGVVSFLFVAIPWYAWVAAETKAKFLQGFLMKHNVERFLAPMESHRGSPLYYPIVLLVATTPWSIFFGLVMWYSLWSVLREPADRWKKWWNLANDPDQAAAYRLLVVWLSTFIVFFSLAATKLPNYILPVSVPFAILTARFLVRWCRGQIHPAWWLLGISVWLLLFLGIGTSVGLLIASGTWPLGVLRTQALPSLALGSLLGVIPLLGGLVAWQYLRLQRRTALVMTVTVTTITFVAPLAAWGNAALNELKASQPLVEQANTLQRDQEIRVGCWRVEHLPSINFYCQRDVINLTGESELQPFLRYPIPVYLFLPVNDWEALRKKLTVPCREIARHRDLYRSSEIVVVTNN